MLETKTPSAELDTKPAASQSKWLRIVKEPFLHFLIFGAGIYLLFAFYGTPESDEEAVEKNKIVVTKGEIDWLAASWQARWNRPPTNDELVGLVREHVKETVMYREAIAMGLDKDDTIIRRRLKQKLEFLAQDLIQPKPATDDELQTFFEANIDRYRVPDLITFTHAFLDPDKREEKTLEDAKILMTELAASDKAPDAAARLGDPFMLQNYYPERSQSDLSKLFGREFANSVAGLEPEKWHGPVLSGYGTHLVYVHQRRAFPPPEFEQVADRLREDFENEKRQQLNDEYIASLLARYEVVVEEVEDEESSDGQVAGAEDSQ